MQQRETAGFTIYPGEIAYAISRESDEGTSLVKCGVMTFSDGSLHEKNIEKSACADRRARRQLRRNYTRKRLRRIAMLNVLSSMGFCPEVPKEQLDAWRYGKIYPDAPGLRDWLSTDFENDRNPYHDRYICATHVLDLDKQVDRYCLGRALYHMGQRRGYLSNARDEKNNNMAGKVNSGITALSAAIEKSGCPTLGAYFYRQMKSGERVRGLYTGREVHYLSEFNYICDFQNIPDEQRDRLRKAIFFHRPLKSQKGSVGRCGLEPSKFRCQRSNPLFEEFRMYSFVNNIKYRRADQEEFHSLSQEEVDSILHLFYRSNETFKFQDIARAVAGKDATISSIRNHQDTDYVFNFDLDKSIPGNLTIHHTIAVLGKESGADWRNWRKVLASRYVRAEGRSEDDIAIDVWHVMMFFDDRQKIMAWFRDNLGVTDTKCLERVAKYVPEQEYASLSLCAVRKILPYLRQRRRFDEAVILASLDRVLPAGYSERFYREACDVVSTALDEYASLRPNESKDKVVSDAILDFCPEADVERMYRPSLMSRFKPAILGTGGRVTLDKVDFGFRNPVAHRAEVQFRRLVNELSASGLIGRDTAIRVMVSTEMHGMNERRGIAEWQAVREKERAAAVAGITEYFRSKDKDCRVVVTENQITKWLLWEEQKHVCLYTGKAISMDDFLGEKACFDIEHTVPLSRGGDDSLMNKTLCDSVFNRKYKGSSLPSELDAEVYSGLLGRVEALGWISELSKLESTYNMLKDKAKKNIEARDFYLQKAAFAQQRLDYLSGKVMRLKMTKVPEGFAFAQDSIGKAVRNHVVSYLKTGYRIVFSESERTVKGFRRIWDLPSRVAYDKNNHRRNCIDAIVLSCLNQSMHRAYKRYSENHDAYSWVRRPDVDKPWATFTQDVLAVQESLAVRYETRDNFVKGRKHVLRGNRRNVIRDAEGNLIYQSSDCVGTSLHKDTYYSCRKCSDGSFAFGVRKPLDKMKADTAAKIVDTRLREAVLECINKHGEAALKDFVFCGQKVRHVRINVRPKPYIPITVHRDLSDKEHKRFIYVENEHNYCLALYEGGGLEIINPFTALGRRKAKEPVIRQEMDGCRLTSVLKTGTMVLFYENDPSELKEASASELARRLYYLKAFCLSGGQPVLTFKSASETRIDKYCEFRKGYWKNSDPYRPVMTTAVRDLKMLVEGYDFTINYQGDIVLN